MSKARKEYECFECKNTILIGEEYERKARYNNPDDKKYSNKSIQKCICKKCILENKFSYIDESFNKILEDSSVIKFGFHYGTKWEHLNDDYIIYLYTHIKDGKHRKEIETEYNRRLSLIKPNIINPLNLEKRNLKIGELKEKYIKNESAKYKSLSIYMEKIYKKILEFGSVSYRKKPNEKYTFWSIDNNDSWDDYVETNTILALYNRGLLKPVEFTDNILDFRPIKYVAIEKDITPVSSERLTKRSIIEWANNNEFGIREDIVWKTNWRDSDVVKHGYEFTFKSSLENVHYPYYYSISCYGTLNDIKKYNSLNLVKKIKEEVYLLEKNKSSLVDVWCQIFRDKYAITDISNGYGLFGKTTTPFFDEHIKDFWCKKHNFN